VDDAAVLSGTDFIDLAQYLPQILHLKYGPQAQWGWSPSLRRRFGYTSPDDWYEATLWALINENTAWIDVGCGRDVFPSNSQAAKLLADKCRLLVGIDPSDNIDENAIVHERAKCLIEDYRSDRGYDLISMRMVAEHIAHPAHAAAAIAKLVRPGGRIVIYTVLKWSPAPVVAALTPLAMHVWAKRVLWGSTQRDTFPTVYKMNTRRDLMHHLGSAGFVEEYFCELDDCRSFAQIKPLARMELEIWRVLRKFRIRYPERCILGVYRMRV
jgi:SAM-dependent methyltransferase